MKSFLKNIPKPVESLIINYVMDIQFSTEKHPISCFLCKNENNEIVLSEFVKKYLNRYNITLSIPNKTIFKYYMYCSKKINISVTVDYFINHIIYIRKTHEGETKCGDLIYNIYPEFRISTNEMVTPYDLYYYSFATGVFINYIRENIH